MSHPHPTDHKYHWTRDPEGWYHWDFGNGQIMKSKLSPINTSTKETWADTLLQHVESATTYGFGLCHDGTEYDLTNFLYDTWCGSMPWKEQELIELYQVVLAHPKFLEVATNFKNKYHTNMLPLSIPELLAECNME